MQFDNHLASWHGSRTMQAFWLALANLLSMSMTLLMAAVLSRFMSASDYGTYRQVIFIYYTLLMLFSGGMPRAYYYFLARVPVEEGRCVVMRLSLLLWLSAAMFSGILFFGSGVIAEALGNKALAPNLCYFAVTPMLLMPVLGVENILTVYGRARSVTVYVLVSRVVMFAGGVVPVVLFGCEVRGAVIGFVIASAVSCIIGLKLMFLPFSGVRHVKSEVSLREVLTFVTPVFAASVYGFVIASSSQFFVSRYFGVEAFAMFANGYKELPFVGMIIGAAMVVLLPEFTRMSTNRSRMADLRELWRSVVLKSCSMIYPLSVFCCFFASEIVTMIYGDAYKQAAILFMIITVVNLSRIVPYGPLMLATGNGKQFARAHLFTALLIVGLDLCCVTFFPSVLAIAIISSCCTLFYLGLMLRVIVRVLDTNLWSLMPWMEMLKILVISVAGCAVARFVVVACGVTGTFLFLAVGALLFTSLYFPLALWQHLDYRWILPVRSK